MEKNVHCDEFLLLGLRASESEWYSLDNIKWITT